MRKPKSKKEHSELLQARYDLSDKPVAGVTMDRKKPIRRAFVSKLPAGTTWEQLANMTPEHIRDKIYFPKASIRCRIRNSRKAALSFRIS